MAAGLPGRAEVNAARAWLEGARRSCDMQVREIAWPESREWVFDGGALRHRRRAFFRIVGAAAEMNGAGRARFVQPLIDQAEVGILGFLVRAGRDGTEVLVQAKPEPGNVGLVQAAPSVQATESNYRRRHGGRPTSFLERFREPAAGTVLSDGLQSEQGTRFLGKYNRNMVVALPPGTDLREGQAFRWVPAQDLSALLLDDFQVNTDARSILASAPWRIFAAGGAPFGRWRGRGGTGEMLLRSFDARGDGCVLPTRRVLERLRRLRRARTFSTTVVPLSDLPGWEITDGAIRPRAHDAFAIRPFAVASSDREISQWDQPLAASSVEGEAVLLCQERAGVLHFLFDARPEIGFREGLQYGPTIQDTGDEAGALRDAEALRDAAARARVLCAMRHSDEGGRFYRSVTHYRVCLLDPADPIDPGEHLAWMTLGQVARLVRHPGVFSNEARCLISMLLAWL